MRNNKQYPQIFSIQKPSCQKHINLSPSGSTLVMLFLICSFALAGSATQTDWSGGPGVVGPVLELGTSCHVDTSVESSVPGQLGAGREDLRYWVDHLVHFPGNAIPVDLDGDGDMDVAGAAFGGSDIFVWENMDGSAYY